MTRILPALLLSICAVTTQLHAADSAPAKVADGWADGVAIDTVVASYMGDSLEMAVVPTPRKATYSGKLMAYGKAAVVTPKDYAHPATLRDLKKLFPDATPISADAWKGDEAADLVVVVGGSARNPLCAKLLEALGGESSPEIGKMLGDEGYRLAVTRHEGKTVALLAGHKPSGDFWAVQTLRQLLTEKEGQAYVVGVWMEDWPTFPARGSKGMRNYMPQYKDNFSWGSSKKSTRTLIENFGWYVPAYSPGGKLDCSETALAALAASFKHHYETYGMKEFCVKFDDVGCSLRSGYAFIDGDIKNMNKFIFALQKASEADGASPLKRFWEKLDEKGQALLAKATQKGAKWWQHTHHLLNAFNAPLRAPDLYDEVSFAGVELSQALKSRIGEDRGKASADEVVQFNRALMLAALPDQFRSAPESDTSKRFDKYGPAIVYFLTELDKRAKTIDPACKIWYLPNEYAAPTGRYLAKAILDAGGLPKDIALCWTGPQVFSKVLTPEGMHRYMESFGLTQSKGLIYDNFARHGDYFPIPREGRSPELAKHLLGVFSENSTAMNRITRCDQNWNPEAYDPERALKLACREMSNRDPAKYTALHEFVQYYETHRTIPLKMERADKIKELKEVNAKLVGLLDKLKTVFPEKDPMLKDVTKAIGMRLKKQDRMEAGGFRELVAVRAAEAPALDGVLDEACWKSAATTESFVALGEKWMDLGPETGVPIPAEHATTVRVCYDDTHLYIAAECLTSNEGDFNTTKSDGSPAWWARSKGDAEDTHGIWHGPSVELFIAPDGDRMNYYQLVAGLTGLKWDKHSGKPSDVWDSGWKVKTTVEAKRWSMEAAIPLKSLTEEPIRKGDLWAANFCRTRPGRQMWTFVYGPGGFHTPEDFGVLKFE